MTKILFCAEAAQCVGPQSRLDRGSAKVVENQHRIRFDFSAWVEKTGVPDADEGTLSR
jgi:hypothetical protein